MTDIFGIKSGVNAEEQRVCRVAYTLNNEQPVISTIIGDQPLFYMDYECEYEEDDGVFDPEVVKLMETELSQLRDEVVAFEKFSGEFVQTTEDLFEDLMDSGAEITKEVFSEDKEESDNYFLVIRTLEKSRLAKAYLDFAKQYDVSISLSDQVQNAHFNAKSGTITINSNIDFEDQVLLAVRELRRHWQYRHGALLHPLTFYPDEAISLNRLQSADLAVNVVRAAWELQLSGERRVWERVENSSFSDLGHAFAREAFLDFRTLNNGQALTAAFEAWFLSERCKHEDKRLIQQMLADYQGYVFDSEDAPKTVTPVVVSALGTMPFGKNYLSSHAQTIIEDALFTEVRDRSNANFLWFIKFERTFKEAEQELQMKPSPTAEGVRHSADKNIKQGQGYAQQNGEIVSFFSDTKRSRPISESGAGVISGRGADIIHLEHWAGK